MRRAPESYRPTRTGYPQQLASSRAWPTASQFGHATHAAAPRTLVTVTEGTSQNAIGMGRAAAGWNGEILDRQHPSGSRQVGMLVT